MKSRALCLLIAASVLLSCMSACGSASAPAAQESTSAVTDVTESADFAASLKLDMASETAKQEVTVKSFVDGDTVHFHVPGHVHESGVLKARFLAINTPESTGKIEEYGKKASEFTKHVLSAAFSILIESESGEWNPDATGGRYLVWVWYQPEEGAEYRNLNIEILQNGLAVANSTAASRYGETAMAALNQAKAQKLNIYSGEPDPDFYYGDSIELTLKELRANVERYAGKRVAFEGVVTTNSGTQGVFVEELDQETGMYFGIYLYYGHGLNGQGLDILSVGNRVRIVGTVQYYEAGGTYQISDLNYRMMRPDDPGNIQKLGEGYGAAFVPTDPDLFINGEVDLVMDDGAVSYRYCDLAMATSVKMDGLKVLDIHTTQDEESSAYGAMTLYCDADGVPVTVRTAVLHDPEGTLVTADTYLGRTISVRGFVDKFDGVCQIKIFSAESITITDE